MDDVQTYIELIKENIKAMITACSGDGKRELYDELFQVSVSVGLMKHPTIRVAGEEYPHEFVKSRFELESSHLEYVIIVCKIPPKNHKYQGIYMVTALYNAPLR